VKVTNDCDRAFVLGLDGVPWYLLERWVANDELEHFGRLVDEGAAGGLESTVPPTTPLAWPSIATGVGPDKHHVYGFQKLSGEHTQRLYASGDVDSPALWDILSPALVGNVPLTYPAPDIDGKLISGMFTPQLDEHSTHPPSFREAVLDRVPDYELGLDWNQYVGEETQFLTDLADLVEKRREVMELLMAQEDWRLFFFVYTAPDRLQHLVWNEEMLLEHYQHLDEILGDVMAYVAERDATLYVVSDHGFGPISKQVAINRVLENAGLLTRREETVTRDVLGRFGVSRDSVTNVLDSVGISKRMLQSSLPDWLLDSVATRLPGDHALYDVDYSRTKAFAFTVGTVYVNDTGRFEQGCVDPVDVPAVKREVAEALGAVRDPETGTKVLTVYDGDELYPADDSSPDLVVSAVDGYERHKSITDSVFSDTGGKAAGHRSEGVLFAWGPDIKPGSTPADAEVVDVVPTLLHGLDEPIPDDTDGKVLTEIFAPGSGPATRQIETRRYETEHSSQTDVEDSEDVQTRLRGLGYIE